MESQTMEGTCPECSGRLDRDAGERYCADCGLVVDEDAVDHGPEWRRFDDESTNRSRVGAPLTVTRHDKGLSSEIGYKRDGYGNELSARKRRQLGRLRREHSRARYQSKRERNRMHGLREVRRIIGDLDAGKEARKRASKVWVDAHNADVARGRSVEAVAAAATYVGVRDVGRIVLPDEAAKVSAMNVSKLLTFATLVSREVGVGLPVVMPAEHVPAFCSALDLDNQTTTDAIQLALDVQDAGAHTNGAPPSAIAAGCVYAASPASTTQADVGEVAGRSLATVRKHARNAAEIRDGVE